MKNIKVTSWLVIASLLLACGGSSDEGGTLLVGNVENLPTEGFVHLEKVAQDGVVKIDTLEVGSSGDFSSQVTINEAAFYRLNFNDRQYVSLILTGQEEEVTVNAHGNDPRGFSEVSGSYDTEYKNQMDEIMQQYQQKRAQFQQDQIAARNAQDYQAFNEVNNNVMQLGIRTETQLKKLIWDATPSLASIYGLQMIDQERNYTFLDSVATQLLSELPGNFHVQNLVASLESKKSLTIGADAPNIALPNPEGEVISLTSLKGKYVLIDFWAAWCRPCRAENPNVVKLYNKYSSENFEILGVSLDKTRNAWLTAIEQDQLPWLHISDLKFWRSEAALTYQIKAIPATYLIDPDGKIIAKNLRGPNLAAKLKEIFG